MSARSGRGTRAEVAPAAWDPLRELTGLKERLNRLFESAMRRGGVPGAGDLSGWAPAIDLREEADEFVLSAEIPGIPRQDVRLKVDGRTITVEGERRTGGPARGAELLRMERSYGSFSRTFTLPSAVDPAKVRATLRQGVLEVRLAKTARSRSATVKVRVD
ncbi:MAG TPA: Hsp20/alpha crystallin family protein [Candidatus Polarisedimenticolia bacterium]|nr:Hsp20/alpha crystallin family protein [Candidatus Polarisedimenticolia bacterium]